MPANRSQFETDELTGLLSRRAFEHALELLLRKSKRADELFSLAFLDVDRFMQINQDYGQPAGDDILKTIAEMIRQVCGPDTICARYGGDEFAILFPGQEREQTLLLLETLRGEAARRVFGVGNVQVNIEGIALSGGIACYPLDGRSKSALLRQASQALYRAKVTGRAKIRLAYAEKMVPKTSHYTQTQLERLTKLAVQREAGEAELQREALDDLLTKYGVDAIER